MATLGAIADDLTGATDLAITLTSAGFRTTVVLERTRTASGARSTPSPTGPTPWSWP